MSDEKQVDELFLEKEHQGAYVFDPLEELEGSSRPVKRRKVGKKGSESDLKSGKESLGDGPIFQPLFEGTEPEESVRIRQQLFEKAWSGINGRVQRLLRDVNQSTLNEVSDFMRAAPSEAPDGKIPTAFVMTGPNIASQDLLFEQLADMLQTENKARTVRLRSGDATNLKATLKKIIQDVTSKVNEEDDDLQLSTSQDGRKYLNYDLEALHHYTTQHGGRVAIAFQDSEAFDTAILADLISLLSSWLDRIPIVLLFGVATSLELFQARLLKSTCQRLYGDQFDVEQSASIVSKVFKTAVAHVEAPLRLGPSLMRSLLDRQQDQVTSIPIFVNSLKYAYMCHFFANPLSACLDSVSGIKDQSQLTEALRMLPSFRRAVETALEQGDIGGAKLLLDDDSHLLSSVKAGLIASRQWNVKLLRTLKVLGTIPGTSSDFAELYLDTMSNGLEITDDNLQAIEAVQKMAPTDMISFLKQVLDCMQEGDSGMGLDPWAENDTLFQFLSETLEKIESLQREASDEGNTLRSKYSGQSRVLRATVIAQKVALSRDTANLTQGDMDYTDLVDSVVQRLRADLHVQRADEMVFQEIWLYDARAPYKDVSMPKPRVVVERALSRPHDYLACACCQNRDDQVAPTLPSTAILYQMYLETGSLVNVADLWSAYQAIVGEEGEGEGEGEGGPGERTALVLFYRGLAELRAMGFVKQSRKKTDHIAKLAWRGL